MKGPRNFAVAPRWSLLLNSVGLDPAEVLRRARLPGDLFNRKEASLRPDEYFRLWQAMDDASGDPGFSLDIVAGMSTEIFDPVLFTAFCSPNLDVALERIRQFKPLIGPLRLDLSRTRTDTTVVIDTSAIALPVPPSFVVAELAFFVQFARLATQDRIVPVEVLSPIELPCLERCADFFGTDPKRSDRAAISFAAGDAAKPFVSENARMWEIFEPGLKERLSELGDVAKSEDRVRGALLELLPAGSSSMKNVSGHLAMSTRTLQRRLNEEGTSFQAILETVRAELAHYYLTNSSLPSAQISLLLGFKDPNSFFRAFHAWSGATPESVRSREIR